MDPSELGSRRTFVWYGRDLTEDTNRLTAAVASACAAELFELNGSLARLLDGQFVPVSRDSLREIITRHIAPLRLTNRGTPDKPDWRVEYYSFEFPPGSDTGKQPDEKVLINLAEGLKLLVARGPSAAPKLSVQQQAEVHARLREGEPQARIADAYNVGIETIRQLAR